MHKSIVTSILLFIVLSCAHTNKKNPDGPGTPTDTILSHDTLSHTERIPDSGSNLSSSQKSFPVSKNISMVEDKMKNKAILNDIDYGIIGKFLIQNKDESFSEEVGYYLFEYFNGNGPANEGYAAFLGKKGSAYKEKILGELVEIMCIDLGEDKYTYDKLISDFSLFKGSHSAQMALKTCVDNHVD